MKTKFTLVAALIAAVCTPAFPADSVAPAHAAARVEIVYVNPENFTDLKDSQMGSDRGREAYQELLKEHLIRRAGKHLTDGQSLTITITDIDMAGDFEPWRGADFNDVRVVKGIYQPRASLSFKLTDASGAVVKEGERHLNDPDFQRNVATGNSGDPLRYEKVMLDDWLRSEFPKAKADKQKK